ncbi:hypothetical protein [Roseovarius aestuariivivens]|uniref:hypothetical protein n=1 Tax=Roseovarius aestuariivivens TaxID=1888910 RepID=UPI001080BBBA|nr:hypothetical protein [Roseovarius aestuariivivens]
MPGSAAWSPRRLFRALLRLGMVIVLVIAANQLLQGLQARLDLELSLANADRLRSMVWVAAGLYTLALAVPFVPGVEIGLALMAVLGLKVVPLVYLCTIAGLCLAFLAGRSIPLASLARLARDAHLRRTEDLLCRFDRVPAARKLAFLLRIVPGRVSAVLLRHRYLALLVLINLPGNVLIGGGGGIALMAGASRIFTWPRFLLTVAVAVSPVPLALMLAGPRFLAP